MARKLVVEIVGDTSSLDRAFSRTSKNAEGFGLAIRRGALIAGTALAGGLALAAKAGFNELAEGQKVAAQTGAVLESTGGIANVTAKEVEALATAQSRLTGIDDELVQAGENLLLTFKQVRNEVGKGNDIFDRATKSALDLSVAGFGSVETTAKTLGKALNDPIKGMTALGRAGVTFTQKQRDTIKALVETGDVLGAQRLILKEVESQVGGSAKAYGETLPGQLNKAKNAFQEVAAGVVVVLLPALTTLATVVQKVAGFFQEHQTTAKVLAGALTALAGVLITVGVATKAYAAFQAIVAAATGVWTAAQWLLNAALTANPIGVVVVALAALVAGLVLAYRHSETFRRIVDAAFKVVKAAAEAVLNFFRDHWKTIAVLISGPFAPLVLLATDAFGIRSKLIAAAQAIIGFFRDHWKTIAVLISGPFAPLVALATDAFGIRSRLVGAFQAIVDGVREKVGALVELVRGIPGRLRAALGDLGSLLYNAGVQIIQGLINGITDKLGDLYGLVGGIGGKIAGLKGPIEKDRQLLVPQGRAIIEGLIAGMQERLPDLERTAAGIGPSLASGVSAVGSGLNLREMFDGGGAPPDATPTVEALTAVNESVVAATETVNVFKAAIEALPLFASVAFGALLKVIATSLKRLPELLDPAIVAVQNLADAIHSIGAAAYYARAALKDTVAEILDLWAKLAAGGVPIPQHRQHGGPVKAGNPYIVGESGPELFIPGMSGRVVPGASGGMGAGGVNVFVYGDVTGEEIVNKVREGLLRINLYNPGNPVAR